MSLWRSIFLAEVQYAWYKNDPGNYIQTDLKPYIFISNDGRLYFSEVTNDDKGEYFCVVTRTGTNWNSGVTSLPTQLIVTDGSKDLSTDTHWNRELS